MTQPFIGAGPTRLEGPTNDWLTSCDWLVAAYQVQKGLADFEIGIGAW
jgi:hypothetical protein